MRNLVVGLVQAAAEHGDPVTALSERLRRLAARYPQVELWVFPELHLENATVDQVPLSDARAVREEGLTRLAHLAYELGVWLVPGSFHEHDGDHHVFNTAPVFGPDGRLVTTYRKIFPWRPAETATPGSRFELFDIPGKGRVGLSICYDIWFPEHTRHLTWMGADLVLNIVQTGTSDRPQELVIVQGNAIMNQVWVASVNAAAPTGRGRSLIVDPDGAIHLASPDSAEEVLTAVIDLGRAEQVRRYGTAGVTTPWRQFYPADTPIPLPLYEGRLNPSTWYPDSAHTGTPSLTEDAAVEPVSSPEAARRLRPAM